LPKQFKGSSLLATRTRLVLLFNVRERRFRSHAPPWLFSVDGVMAR
jgi:hypothetical protein